MPVLNHARDGSGPPLLLLHGIGMSHAAWVPVLPLLAARRTIYAVDLPGFGASPALDGPATMPGLARACADFMRAQGHERFHVAGNSLGGGVALHLALEGVALSACALSPAGFAEGWERAWLHLSLIATRAIGHPMVRLGPLVGRSAAARRLILVQMLAHGERWTPAEFSATFVDLVRSEGFHPARRRALNWRFPDRPGLDVPVTIAWGEHDRLLLRRQAARARVRLPGARHVSLHGLGHLPIAEDPERIAEVVLGAG